MKAKVSVLSLLFAVSSALPTSTLPVFAQPAPQFLQTDSLSFSERLSRLEQAYNLPPPVPDSAILDRVARVEQTAMGQVRMGSIVDRLKALESIPKAKAMPAPSQQQPQQQQPPSQQANSQPISAPTSAPLVTPPATPKPSMADFIKAARVSQIVVTSDIYPPSFARIQAASDQQADRSDYVDALLKESKNKVLKFQKFPVPVYITPIAEFGYQKAVREAMDDWRGRTNGLVSFVETKNQKDARIIVIFSRMGVKPGADCSLGAHTVTKWKSRGPGKVAFLPVGSIPVPLYIPSLGPKYSVPPQLIEVNLDVIYGQDLELRPLVLKNICTHELGHALGMLGHSPVKGDMMYMNTDEFSRLSQRDINTVTRYYERKADIPL